MIIYIIDHETVIQITHCENRSPMRPIMGKPFIGPILCINHVSTASFMIVDFPQFRLSSSLRYP